VLKNHGIPRWRGRPTGSSWGDFGPEDQIGRMNLITPEIRIAAVQEVREGVAFCLSLPLDFPGGTALNSLNVLVEQPVMA